MTKPSLFDSILGISDAQAHCDVPCGIYDPIVAQIAAQSVVRMIDIINENAEKGIDGTTSHNIARAALVKEEEAEKCKREVRIIWGDFMKGELLEKYPETHSLAHSIMLAGSAARQGHDRAKGEDLVEKVCQFAELFWKMKGKETERKTAPYAPGLPMVLPVL